VVAAAHTFVDGLGEVTADEVHVLADLEEHAGHAGILADRDALAVRNFKVFDDVVENALSDLAVLAGAAGADGALYVLRQVLVRLDAQLLNDVCDLADFNFTHSWKQLPFLDQTGPAAQRAAHAERPGGQSGGAPGAVRRHGLC